MEAYYTHVNILYNPNDTKWQHINNSIEYTTKIVDVYDKLSLSLFKIY